MPLSIGFELADKNAVIGLVIEAKVLNVEDFEKQFAFVLGQSSINEHRLPLRIGSADVKTFQSEPHAEVVFAEVGIIVLKPDVQVFYANLQVVQSTCHHIFPHAAMFFGVLSRFLTKLVANTYDELLEKIHRECIDDCFFKLVVRVNGVSDRLPVFFSLGADYDTHTLNLELTRLARQLVPRYRHRKLAYSSVQKVHRNFKVFK